MATELKRDVEQRLNELLVFTNPPTAFGLPRGMFFNVALVSALVVFQGTWWAGLIVFGSLFAPLYRAHQTDPRAASVWQAAMRERVRGVSPAVISYVPVRFDR